MSTIITQIGNLYMKLLSTNLAAEWPYSVAEECLGLKVSHKYESHFFLYISEIFLFSDVDDENYVYCKLKPCFSVSV